VPFGDQVSAEIDCAPGGAAMVLVAPVRGFTNTSAVLVLVVTDRARFALVSTWTPAR
jgi:hypothetical protein